MTTRLDLDGRSLSLADFQAVTQGRAVCRLTDDARQKVAESRRFLAGELARGEVIYGVNTGFGELANVRIEPDKVSTLQRRLILSHAAGVGEPLPDEAVRGMLLLRANTLACGFSGVRPEVVDALLALLEHGVLPLVPSRGSVGASGDLAPLAHLALPLLGEGRVRVGGVEQSAARALAEAGLAPLELTAKEGLALINGTQAMTALLALSVLDARRLVRLADLVGALSADAMRGTDTAFDPRIHALRPHPGQRASAANLRRLLAGSAIRESHRVGDTRVQDPYSLRCMPQVHGAVRDLLTDVERKVEIEINSVTDNPLVVEADGDRPACVLSGGNFHGEPMAFASDILGMGLAELASISERRIDKLTNSAFSLLPPFLVRDAGLNSGFMIAQVTAAALVSENKGLAHPASVDSIPTSADKEDHVSMGMGAALKLRAIVDNVYRVFAIELFAAAQGIDFLRPLSTSAPLERLHREVRGRIPFWDEDRLMATGIAAAEDLLRGGLDALLADLD